MQITVTIPDELAAQVQARGLVLETYVGELVRQAEAERKRQAVEAMLEFADTHGLTLGSNDLKSMVHEGHKY